MYYSISCTRDCTLSLYFFRAYFFTHISLQNPPIFLHEEIDMFRMHYFRGNKFAHLDFDIIQMRVFWDPKFRSALVAPRGKRKLSRARAFSITLMAVEQQLYVHPLMLIAQCFTRPQLRRIYIGAMPCVLQAIRQVDWPKKLWKTASGVPEVVSFGWPRPLLCPGEMDFFLSGPLRLRKVTSRLYPCVHCPRRCDGRCSFVYVRACARTHANVYFTSGHLSPDACSGIVSVSALANDTAETNALPMTLPSDGTLETVPKSRFAFRSLSTANETCDSKVPFTLSFCAPVYILYV